MRPLLTTLFSSITVLSSPFRRCLQGRSTLNVVIQRRAMSESTAATEVVTHSAPVNSRSKGYVDVHAHLIHDKFIGIEDQVALKCRDAGLEYVIVNGLDPPSNRAVLDLCSRHSPYLLPAAGIYPLDAACHVITPDNWQHNLDPPAKFDIEAEVSFIESLAKERRIVAIGECGLDRHYLTDAASMMEQERVLRLLMKVAVQYDLPLILHSRKAEKRVLELLLEEGVRRADFHCFCGKVKLGMQIAEAGYYLSIPSALVSADKHSTFYKLAMSLPIDRILTETDSPYMGPVRGMDNDPTTVIQTVEAMAGIRQCSIEEIRLQIRSNFRALFNL